MLRWRLIHLQTQNVGVCCSPQCSHKRFTILVPDHRGEALFGDEPDDRITDKHWYLRHCVVADAVQRRMDCRVDKHREGCDANHHDHRKFWHSAVGVVSLPPLEEI